MLDQIYLFEKLRFLWLPHGERPKDEGRSTQAADSQQAGLRDSGGLDGAAGSGNIEK